MLACAWPAPAPAAEQSPGAAGLAVPAAALNPIVLDPGHGGRDLGAVVGGRMEKDISLEISRKVKDRLEGFFGVPTRLTRDADTYLGLDQRIRESLDLRASLFVSLHVNQVRRKTTHGITVYAFGPSRRARSLHRRRHRRFPFLAAPPREEIRESAGLAESVAESLRARGFGVGPPEHADFYVLKNPGVPSILIELGYLSNPKEAARLSDPAYQDALALAIAQSLSAYAAEAASAGSAQLARKP